jgi:hypothetical protein
MLLFLSDPLVQSNDSIQITVTMKETGLLVNETQYDFGFVKLDDEKETNPARFLVENSGNYYEDVYASAWMDNWTLGAIPSVDQMVLWLKTTGGNMPDWETITVGSYMMANHLAAQGLYSFGAKIHSPTTATIYDKQKIIVTLSAVGS